MLYRKLRYFRKTKKESAPTKGRRKETVGLEDKEAIVKAIIVKVKDIVFVEEIVHIKKFLIGHIPNIINRITHRWVLNIFSSKQDRILFLGTRKEVSTWNILKSWSASRFTWHRI